MRQGRFSYLTKQEFALLTVMIMIVGLVLFYEVFIQSFSKINSKSVLIELHATARIINFGKIKCSECFCYRHERDLE